MIKLIDFRKLLVLNCCLFLLLEAHCQIIVNEDDSSDSLSLIDDLSNRVSETEAYFGVFSGHSDRILGVNEGLFAGEIGERANEEPVVVASIYVGLRSTIYKNLSLDIGAGFTKNGERYSLNEADSLYEYQNTYRHLSFPIQLALSSGKKEGVLFTAGITPKAFISKRTDLKYTDENGIEQEEKIIKREGFEFFLFDVTSSLGWRFQFDDSYGIYILGRGMYQLTNNYDKQSPLTRNPWAVGIHLGFQFYL